VRPALANIITARVPEADLLIDTMTVRPQGNRAFLISDTIRRLKAADIWAKLDVLWMLAAETSQAARLNWKSPGTYTCSEVNSPTFTADRGYAGNGTTSYLDTGWIPNTNGVQLTQDSASIGVYINAGTDTANALASAIGADQSGGLFIRPRAATDTLNGRVNQTSSVAFSGTVGTRYGLTVFDRSASTTTTAFRNGASVGTFATASSGRPIVAVFIGCINSAGAAAQFVDNRIATAFSGASLTATQHTALHAINNAYLNSMGAA